MERGRGERGEEERCEGEGVRIGGVGRERERSFICSFTVTISLIFKDWEFK